MDFLSSWTVGSVGAGAGGVGWFVRRCLKEDGLRWRGAGKPVDDADKVGSLGAGGMAVEGARS